MLVGISKQVKELLYRQELFRARFEIREDFLKNFTREIYENIAQVLSLVKFQLAEFEPEQGKDTDGRQKIAHWGILLGQVIKDLRILSKGFYRDLLSEEGLVNALQNEIRLLEKQNGPIAFTITGSVGELGVENKLILFSIIKEMIGIITTAGVNTLTSVDGLFEQQRIYFVMSYDGPEIKWPPGDKKKKAPGAIPVFNIFEKANLINARLRIKKGRPDKPSFTLVLATN